MFDITVSPEQDGNLAFPQSRTYSVSAGDLDSDAGNPYIVSIEESPDYTLVEGVTTLDDINSTLQTGLLLHSILLGLILGCLIMFGFWLGGRK